VTTGSEPVMAARSGGTAQPDRRAWLLS
jgi:hypothetical protein